jgi:hypothetical protein
MNGSRTSGVNVMMCRLDGPLLDAFKRDILPQLKCLNLRKVMPGYLPSSLPALRDLTMSCLGDKGCGVAPCGVRDYPHSVTKLEVLCGHDCSVAQALQGVSNAAKSGLNLRELSLTAQFFSKATCMLPKAAFQALEGRLERLTIDTGQVRRKHVLGYRLAI